MVRSKCMVTLMCLLMAMLMLRGVHAQEAAPTTDQMLETTPRLPADTVWAIVVPNVSEARNQWNSSRFAQAFKSPEAAKLREAFNAEWEEMKTEFKEDSNVEFDTFIGHFEGFVALFSTDWQGGKEDLMDVVFLAEVPEARQEQVRAMLEEMIAKEAPQDAVRSAEDFMGEKIYKITYTETDAAGMSAPGMAVETATTTHMQYAFTGNLVVCTEGPNDPIKKVLNTLKSPEAQSLDKKDEFRKLTGELGGNPEALFWINIPAILADSTAEEIEPLKKLGVADLGAALVSVDLAQDGLRSNFGMLMPREKTGIVELLYAGRANAIETARLVPSDAFRFNSYTADFGNIWQGLRRLAMQINPQADVMIGSYVETFRTNYGIDIENDLLANIQGEHATYRRPGVRNEQAAPPAAPGAIPEPPADSTVILLSLVNGQKTNDALDGLFTKLSGEPFYMPVKALNQDGVKIWTMSEDSPFAAVNRYALGLTPSHLVIGNGVDQVQQSVRIIRGESQDTLAQTADFQRAVGEVDKANLRFFSYTGPGSYDAVVEQLRFALQGLSQFDNAGSLEITPDDVPPAEWWRRYFGASIQTAHLSPELIRFDMKLSTVE